jgi:predicted MFS family arabinose efflux permease
MHLQKKDVILMAICTGLIVANIYYIQPLIVLISHTFNVPENIAGSTTYLTQAGYAAGLLILVPLGDMIERRKQIIATTLLAIIALIGVATAQSFVALQISCFFVGVGSIVPQLILPLAATLSNPNQRGKVVGTVMSGLLVGILLSRTLSGAVAEWMGWRSMFWIAAILCSFLAIFMQKRFPKNYVSFPGHYGQLMHSLIQLIKTQPVLREATAINMCCFAVFGSFWTTMVLHLSNAPFHYASHQIGLFGIAGAAGAITAPFVGKLGDKGSPRKTIKMGLSLFLISIAVLYLGRDSLWFMILGTIFIDIAQQSVHVTNQTRVYALLPEARNRLNTVFMSMSFVGTTLGSAIGLYLWKLGAWHGVMIGSIIIIGIAWVIFISTKSKKILISRTIS